LEKVLTTIGGMVKDGTLEIMIITILLVSIPNGRQKIQAPSIGVKQNNLKEKDKKKRKKKKKKEKDNNKNILLKNDQNGNANKWNKNNNKNKN
jgi:hypothetical protein